MYEYEYTLDWIDQRGARRINKFRDHLELVWFRKQYCDEMTGKNACVYRDCTDGTSTFLYSFIGD